MMNLDLMLSPTWTSLYPEEAEKLQDKPRQEFSKAQNA